MQRCKKCDSEYKGFTNICSVCEKKKAELRVAILCGAVFVVFVLIFIFVMFLNNRDPQTILTNNQFALTNNQGIRDLGTHNSFSSINFFSDGLAIVSVSGNQTIIEIKSGRSLIPLVSTNNIRYDVFDDIVHVIVDNLQGVIDIQNGNILIPFGEYQNIQIFDNYAIVTNDEDVGLLNIRSGEKIIELGEFNQIQNVSEGMAIVGTYVNAIRTELNSRYYNRPCINADCFNPDCFTWYDCYYNCEYCYSCHFTEIAVWSRGIIDIDSGNEILPLGTFNNFWSSIYNGMVVAHQLGGDIALVDVETGAEKIPFGRYDRITGHFSEGIIIVERDGLFGVLNADTFEYIVPIGRYSGFTPYFEVGVAVVENRELSGLLCFSRENEIITMRRNFARIQPITDNHVLAKSNESTVSISFYYVIEIWTGRIVYNFTRGGISFTATGVVYNPNSYHLLSNGAAVIEIIKDSTSTRYAGILDLLTGEYIIPLISISDTNLSSFFSFDEMHSNYPIYSDGLIFVEITTNDIRRIGVVETATGIEIIPIIQRDDIHYIMPLYDGFIALQNHNGSWSIEHISSFS